MRQFHQKRLALPWQEFAEDFKLEIDRSGYRLGEDWERQGGIDRRGEKWIWERIGDRPEHLADAETMQVCAALMLKIIGAEAATGSENGTDTATDASG